MTDSEPGGIVDGERDRRVAFEAATNFRDLGGYPTADGGRTRWGLVFRSDVLHGLTEADLALYASLGIRAVYDLRSEAEREAQPNSVESTWHALTSAPRTDDAGLPPLSTAEDGEAMLRQVYTGLVDHAAPAVGALLTALADPAARPAVFHCHAGKDRTGAVAAVLLLTLGVDRDMVLDDYELTGRYRAQPARDASVLRLLGLGAAPEAAAAIVATHRSAMAAALDLVTSGDGGIDGWLTGPAGVAPEAVVALRTDLVEHPEP